MVEHKLIQMLIVYFMSVHYLREEFAFDFDKAMIYIIISKETSTEIVQ
jgi:hypothetical protein